MLTNLFYVTHMHPINSALIGDVANSKRPVLIIRKCNCACALPAEVGKKWVEASCGCPKYANDVYLNIHNPNPNPNPD